MHNLQHADDGEAPPSAVRDALARLRRRVETLSESQIRLALALSTLIQVRLHRAAGYATINDFLRSEFGAHMSEKSLRMYLEAGCYARTHKIALEEAISRGFDRIFLEARAYAALHRVPDPVQDLDDLTAPELRRIANWRSRPTGHPNGAADEEILTGFIGQVITGIGRTSRGFRVATPVREAAVYHESGKGRLIVCVTFTEQAQ